MKVCIIGNSLVGLTLAKALINKGLFVDIYYKKNHKIYDQTRTIGISKSNIEYFNNHIINIDKILWDIKKIQIYTENFNNNEILNFSNSNKKIFSILKNFQLYEILNKSLKNEKNFNYKNNLSYINLLKQKYKIIINCDSLNEITKKFFSNKIKKNYNSFAYTTIINHKKIIKNDTAIQIFTKQGPMAFLPLSNNKTSIVYSHKVSNDKEKVDVINLIKKFNPKYKITGTRSLSKFKLTSSNLRKYHQDNIMAFGDILHKLHPLAGQGFNMSLRDIRKLLELIENRINLGLDLDKSICVEFQKETKVKNYIFSSGIDFIYEFFNFESRVKSKFLNRSINLVGKNKSLNNLFKKFADIGLSV